DLRCKLTIRKTKSVTIEFKGEDGKADYIRVTRYFQCQCGLDHRAPPNPSTKRQIPWKNIGCLLWVKLVSVHQFTQKGELNGTKLSGFLEISSRFCRIRNSSWD